MEYQPDVKQITGAGGVIAAVHPGGIAAALELQAGDVVVAIDGQHLRDVIDYRFLIAQEHVEILVRRGDVEHVFELEKDLDDDLGVEFVEPLFDRLRTCNNKCPFCFLTQMPKGLRKTLYLKDDDYRLSFLYGNFVTFTNLSEDDWQRIERQRLSPLHISVHATDPVLRAIMLGKPELPDVRAQIARLGRAGITVHTQVVACPGANDGAALDQTIADLLALHPIVQSIAVVPVGLTKYRFNGKAPQSFRAAIQIHETPEWANANWEPQQRWDELVRLESGPAGAPAAAALDLGFCARAAVAQNIPLRCYTAPEASALIDQVLRWSGQVQQRYGYPLVYPSDEFYLLSGRVVPPAEFYGDAPQYSNGVGMVRDLLDGWARARRRLPARLQRPTRLALVCGTLIAPTFAPMVARLNRIDGLHVELLPVVNQFFGETVTVSGLLMGQDVVPALRASGCDRAILPRVMFDHRGVRTLDEYSLEHIAHEAGMAVAMAGEPDELVRYIRALARAGTSWSQVPGCAVGRS